MMGVTRVSAAVIRRGGDYLICQRRAGGELPLLWEFPGGKQEPGESAEECLVRECQEELGVGLRVTGVLATAEHQYPHRRVALTFFTAEIAEGEPRALAHAKIRWAPARTLVQYAFCPADIGIIERLANDASE
jgi:8-oxo-dGTP diphosphatase